MDCFCDECGVSNDLHNDDPDDRDPSDCETAAMKARTIESFFRVFAR